MRLKVLVGVVLVFCALLNSSPSTARCRSARSCAADMLYEVVLHEVIILITPSPQKAERIKERNPGSSIREIEPDNNEYIGPYDENVNGEW